MWLSATFTAQPRIIQGNEYKLKVFGQFDAHSKYDFIQMSIMYSSSKVMFNELTEVSWFEDKRFFLQQ